MTKILLADDHQLNLLGTKNYLESEGFNIIDTCTNGLSAYNLIKLHKPDIAILDIEMPGLNGLEIVMKLHVENYHSTKIILLTMHKEFSVYKKAMEYDVKGFLLKDKAPTELKECIEHVIANKTFESKYLKSNLYYDLQNKDDELSALTIVEKKIVELIAKQYTSKKIGEVLFLSEKTIEKHRTNIIEKLGLPKEKNILIKWAMSLID